MQGQRRRRGDIKFAERLKCNFGNQLREFSQRKNRVLRSCLTGGRRYRNGETQIVSCVKLSLFVCHCAERYLFRSFPRSIIDQRILISQRFPAPRLSPLVVIYFLRIQILITEVREGARRRGRETPARLKRSFAK